MSSANAAFVLLKLYKTVNNTQDLHWSQALIAEYIACDLVCKGFNNFISLECCDALKAFTSLTEIHVVVLSFYLIF